MILFVGHKLAMSECVREREIERYNSAYYVPYAKQ